MSQYESRVSSIETEVGTLKAELMENESKYHLLHCQLAIADHNVKRVSDLRQEMRYKATILEIERHPWP